MNPEHRKLEEIFRKALEAGSAEARDRLIESACQGDALLKHRVEALLRAHSAAGDFLDPGTPGDSIPSTPPPPAADQALEPLIGARIGHLRVLHRVAEGGFCVVYLAEQLEPVRRPVALKILKPAWDVPPTRLRFEAERQAMAVLDHPNIARVYDAGTLPGGLPFVVMEWIQGPEIHHYADNKRLDLEGRLHLFLQVCAGVAHAHSRGVIHQDLKPANILVPEYDGVGIPKIIDFGIASGSQEPWTSNPSTDPTHCLLGTPAYMSPEQAAGGGERVDARADVFSLGALLYELLTGGIPFHGEEAGDASPQQLRRLIDARQYQPPSLRVAACTSAAATELAAVRRTTPARLAACLWGDLDAIVAKALESRRDLRYPAVVDLAHDVRRFLEHREVSVLHSSWAGRMRKFVRRHRVMVAASAVATTVLLSAGPIALVQTFRSHFLEQQIVRQQEVANQARWETAETRSLSMEALGLKAIHRGDAVEAMLFFARAAHTAPPNSPERLENIGRVRLLADHVAVPIRALQLPRSGLSLEFNASATHLAVRDKVGMITVWDWKADHIEPWSRESGARTALAWHPDGNSLALGSHRGGELRALPDGRVLARMETGEAVSALQFSPNLRWLAIAGHTLRLWDVSRQDWLGWRWWHPAPIYALAFSADGTRLITASLDRQARVFELDAEAPAAGRLLGAFHHEKAFPQVPTERCCEHSQIETDAVAPLFLAKDNGLLTWTGLGQVTAWNLTDGGVTGHLPGTCSGTRLVASHHGRWFTVTLQRGTAELRASDAPLSAPGLRLEHRERVVDVAFGPADEWVVTASADHTARLWRLPQGTPLLPPLTHSREVVHAAAAPNGEWIATTQVDGLVRVWRLPRSERETRCLSLDAQGPWRVRVDHAGRQLAVTQSSPSATQTLTFLDADHARYGTRQVRLSGEVIDAVWSPHTSELATLLRRREPNERIAGGRLEIRQGAAPTLLVVGVDLPFAPASLAWHPDGTRIAIGEHLGGIRMLALADLERITWFPRLPWPLSEGGETLAFTRDGRTLVRWWSQGPIEVWDTESRQHRSSLVDLARTAQRSVSLSPNEPELLITDASGSSVLRHLETGTPLSPPLLHQGGVVAQGFSPDGRWIITSGHDRRVLVRDRLTGSLVCPPLMHPDEVFHFEMAPGQPWLATVCRSGSFHLWDLPEGTPLLPAWSPGERLSGLRLALADRHAILFGTGSRIWIRDLPSATDPTPWSLEETTLLAELTSGNRAETVPEEALPSEAWLARMKRLATLRPDATAP